MTLSSLGWNDVLADAFQPFSAGGFAPARVALEHKHAYELISPEGELTATCTGRLLHAAQSRADLPAVGDWVVVHPRSPGAYAESVAGISADIHAVLPRRTCFSRRAAGGEAVEQIIAANVDTVFLVTGLDANFNLRRVERYLAVARASGADAVVILAKSDLVADCSARIAEVAEIASNVPAVALSALNGDGLSALDRWLQRGRTVAVLGSSGVGKSTLINRLLGVDRLETQAVSGVADQGRHTTSRRELIPLPSGALIIDTPGMRELQLWHVDGATLDLTFDDIATLARACRFHDCTHRSEPDCAIQSALADGRLEPDRWRSYLKLQREQAYAVRRADPAQARAERDRWKRIHQGQRARNRLESEAD